MILSIRLINTNPSKMKTPSYTTPETDTGAHVADTKQRLIFDARDLTVSYNGTAAIEDISIKIPVNKITALIGPSGCGKSTLIRCFNRMNDLTRKPQCKDLSTITAKTSTRTEWTRWRCES